jgi:type IV pilus biogenesis protein PilP
MAADADKEHVIANMTTRQKVTALVLVLVLIIVLWEVIGLFRHGSKATPLSMTANKTGMTGNMPGGAPPMRTPQPAELPQLKIMSPREAALVKLQQETQARYLFALNELQVLKVARDIAEANQAIMAAKLATVTAEKHIVDLLTPPSAPVAPGAYAKGLVNPVTSGNVVTTTFVPPEVSYTVVSVSQLEYRWSAVLGSQGRLYNVSIGDILPPDGSKVISISKSGVELEKDNVKKKVSLVPII